MEGEFDTWPQVSLIGEYIVIHEMRLHLLRSALGDELTGAAIYSASFSHVTLTSSKNGAYSVGS